MLFDRVTFAQFDRREMVISCALRMSPANAAKTYLKNLFPAISIFAFYSGWFALNKRSSPYGLGVLTAFLRHLFSVVRIAAAAKGSVEIEKKKVLKGKKKTERRDERGKSTKTDSLGRKWDLASSRGE